MKKIILLIMVMLAGMSSYALAQQTLQLQTYFPAPFGAYDRLRLVPQPLQSDPCPIGSLYIQEAGIGGNIMLCADDGSGVGHWVPLPGVWTQSGNNIYPTDTLSNPLLQVGIGTQSPGAKLHVSGGAGAGMIRVDGTGDSGIDIQQGGVSRGSLGLNAAGDMILQSSSGDLRLGAGGSPFLYLTTANRVGIHDTSPDSLLEISRPGAGDYFRISSSTAVEGNIFDVIYNNATTGKVFINTPAGDSARSNSGSLLLKNDLGNSVVGFGRGEDDMHYSGGPDNVARFVHTGLSTGWLDFISNPDGAPPAVVLSKLTNTGEMHMSRKMSVGRVQPDVTASDGNIVHASVEFQVHEKDAAQDVVMLMSDQGTNTGVSDGQFPYIENNVIGAFMPNKDLWGTGASTNDGGLMISGFSNGAGTDPAGLNLIGVIGKSDPGAVPAVEVDGVKLSGGSLNYMSGRDVVLGVNYSSEPNNDSDGVVFLADGSVGIGFDFYEKPVSGVKLEVNGAMRLQPINAAPFACSASTRGTLFVYGVGNCLCFCNGSAWDLMAGTGPCP